MNGRRGRSGVVVREEVRAHDARRAVRPREHEGGRQKVEVAVALRDQRRVGCRLIETELGVARAAGPIEEPPHKVAFEFLHV